MKKIKIIIILIIVSSLFSFIILYSINNNNKNNVNYFIDLRINKENKLINNENEFLKNDDLFSFNCKNGGISYINDEGDNDDILCLCSFGFSGKNCEIIDSNQNCINPNIKIEYLYFKDKPKHITSIETCKINPSSLCCWSKFRSDNLISSSYLSNNLTFNNLNNISNHHSTLKSILKSYGPWDDNDKKLLNYLFKLNNNNNNKYILKYNNNYLKNQVFTNSSTTKLAFILLIHDIDLEAIELLLNQIYKIKHYYVIHLDNNFKDEIKFKELKNFINNYYLNNNIEIIENRFSNSWGSISLVYSELACYTKLFDMVKKRNLITNENEKWTHVINLSINDFPLKPIEQLEEFLKLNENVNFINEDTFKKENERYNRSWVECGGGGGGNVEEREIISFKFLNNICGIDNGGIEKSIDRNIFKEGSQWKFINFKFAHYLISDFKVLSRLFSMKFTYIPDESFFQIVKSESKHFIKDDNDSLWDISNYRFIPWFNSDKGLMVGMNEIENNFNNETNHYYYFTRKVYTTDIKKAIINKYLK